MAPDPLTEAITHTVGLLTAAGVSATGDVRSLTLPGVWVTPSAIRRDNLAAGIAVDLDLWAIVPNRGGMHDVAALGKLWDQTTRAGLDIDADAAEAVTVTMPNHGGLLTALKSTTTIRIDPNE